MDKGQFVETRELHVISSVLEFLNNRYSTSSPVGITVLLNHYNGESLGIIDKMNGKFVYLPNGTDDS